MWIRVYHVPEDYFYGVLKGCYVGNILSNFASCREMCHEMEVNQASSVWVNCDRLC
jgi:hypothetical protein